MPCSVRKAEYWALPSSSAATSLHVRCCTVSNAFGPRTRISPMCDTSKRPARVRTARCSSARPEYSTGMSHPPNDTIFPPRARCLSHRGVRLSDDGRGGHRRAGLYGTLPAPSTERMHRARGDNPSMARPLESDAAILAGARPRRRFAAGDEFRDTAAGSLHLFLDGPRDAARRDPVRAASRRAASRRPCCSTCACRSAVRRASRASRPSPAAWPRGFPRTRLALSSSTRALRAAPFAGSRSRA